MEQARAVPIRHQDYTRLYYEPRAADYLVSAVHARGEDLDQIDSILAARQPDSVLDVGCGGGHVAYRAAAHARTVIACDLAPAMLDVVAAEAAARGLPNIATRLAAAEQLPFPDASFAMVVSRFSAHHWSDWAAGLRQARRVLLPTGRILLVDTIAPSTPLLDSHLQTVELLRDPSHVRNYRAEEWVTGLAAAGLRATAITTRRLRLDFTGWVARTHAPVIMIEALRLLQDRAPEPVRRHFAMEPDGSWTVDTLTIEAVAV